MTAFRCFSERKREMEIEITWKIDYETRKRTEALWDYHEPVYRINPDRKPTFEELSACPKVFRCYSCGEKHPVRELGGRYHEHWFCSFCIPFIDEWTAGAMMLWDAKRKKQHHEHSKPKKPLTKEERIQMVESAVAWAKANGYPIKME